MLDVRNLIVDSYKMIGEIGDQEALDGTRSTVGLQLLNEQIAMLNLDNYFAFTLQTVTFVPTESKTSYTIGLNTGTPLTSGTEIDVDRPANIIRGYIRSNGSYSTNLEVQQISPQDLPMFTIAGTSTPTFFTYRSTYPLGTIDFNCKLSTLDDVVFVFSKPMPIFAFNDIAEIPYEYEPAIKYGLAYLLANRYGNPVEVISDMKRLRDEAYTVIVQNTQAKTPAHIHFAQGMGNRNIKNMGGY